MKMIRWLPLMIAVTLSNHVRGSVAVQWSMSIPAQVTGTKGQAVVLPCSFTHPQQDTYTGGIRVIWRIEPRGLKRLLHSEGGQIIFQCHVSNSTEGSAGCVDPNAPKRFRLQGDPKLRDLSLHIEDLQPSDSSTYYCRVELDADQDKYGDVNGIKLQVLDSVAVQWSMSIPAQVTGTKGQAVVLPCSFTHPQQDTYTGGIRIIWSVETLNGQVIFQCHVSNSTEGSAGCVDPKAPKRFRLQGDPKLRDLSLHIEDLQPSDSSTYYCRVELDADKDKYGDVNGIKLHVLGSVAVQWSMSIPAQVTGTKGQAVVLPCSFTHPQQDTYTGGIRVIWRVVSLSGQVIFQCHVSNSTEGSSAGCVDPKAPKRFHLQGDPRLRDLSLHIEDLQPSDSSTYYCRVELDADQDKYGDVNGTKLQVLETASVLNVSWETESGTNKLVCTAQGLPLPRVSWLEAGGDPIILNTSLASYPDQHVSTATLLVPRPNKRYVCLVENELGRSVWISAPLVGQPDFSLALLLLLLLGIKLLLLLGIIMMGIVMMKRVQQEKTA